MFNEGKDFILYAWNDETKEFYFLGEKIDYVHNPKEWKKYLNDLVSENKQLKEKVNQLETNNNTAKNFIDQVLQYHLSPFDYKQVDEDINTLIGILRNGSNE